MTGGSGALGLAVVDLLLPTGAECYVPVRSASSLSRLETSRCSNLHPREGVDLTDEESCSRFYRDLPGLWASIHCVGGFAMSDLLDTSLADFRQQIELNLTTCFLCCREAVRNFRRSDPPAGRVVNVTARVAVEPRSGAGLVPYTASKAAIVAMTQAYGQELAAEEIWVNAVAVSILNTAANREAMPDADHDSWPSVTEAARTIAFLASPKNSVTRGAVVPVYGRS